MDKLALTKILTSFYAPSSLKDFEKIKSYFKTNFARVNFNENTKALFDKELSENQIERAYELISLGTTNAALKILNFILYLLNTSFGTYLLTGHLVPFVNLDKKQRFKVMVNWYNSNIKDLRALSVLFFKVSTLVFLGEEKEHENYENLYFSLIGFYPVNKVQEISDDVIKIHPLFQKSLSSKINTFKPKPIILNYDIVVIGSSSGAVVASNLAKHAKVLICEKGSFNRKENLAFKETDSMKKLYENQGFLISSNGSIGILAGSTLGGGTTVNWSASLRTPEYVLNEWINDLNLPGFKDFSKSLDYVCDIMGVVDDIVHNRPNEILINGAKKLGLTAHVIPQNTRGKEHDCGRCGLGCSSRVKQGSLETFLVDALKNGADLIYDFNVLRIIRNSDGDAVGIEGIINNTIPVYVNCKIVVCCAGGLNTPLVLKRSGFKNKNIGRNLKLHPVLATCAFFEEEIYPWKGGIMTSVVHSPDYNDEINYGAKVEVAITQPLLLSSAFPFPDFPDVPLMNELDDPISFIKSCLVHIKYTSSLIAIQRDQDSVGCVYEDSNGKMVVDYELSERDEKSLRKAICLCNEILIKEDAKMMFNMVDEFGFVQLNRENQTPEDACSNFFEKIKNAVIRPGKNCTLLSAHQMSSCKMASDSTSGACDGTGKLWECSNIFVADASVLPTATGVNPMISVFATANMISGHVLKYFQGLEK